ncbi:hypothetical protein [Povalibacter sp.]|uniref:hypothetical protein n=1 Tax=Povalibacter sp. TaxID=1962978 RepID=UPI002F4056CF
MDSLLTALASDTPRLVGLTIAVAAAVVAMVAYSRRRRSSAQSGMNRRNIAVPRAATYRDTPTIRVPDSQRIGRLRKLVRLAPGEHVDVLESPAGAPIVTPPRFRITLHKVFRLDDGSIAAHIAVQFGGAAVSCGPLVEETGFNEFVLPRAARDEPRNCVFHYQQHGDSFDFMRIKLRSLDMDADIAEIDVLQMSEHWPAM